MSDEYASLLLKNQLCFPLYACAKELVRRYKPFLDPLDLTYTQYLSMLALWEHRELPVGKLGELLYLDSGTLTPLLKKLEQKGLVTRRRSMRDERVLTVALTDAGRSLRERAREIPACMAGCLGLAPEECAQLYVLLYRALRAMGAGACGYPAE